MLKIVARKGHFTYVINIDIYSAIGIENSFKYFFQVHIFHRFLITAYFDFELADHCPVAILIVFIFNVSMLALFTFLLPKIEYGQARFKAKYIYHDKYSLVALRFYT